MGKLQKNLPLEKMLAIALLLVLAVVPLVTDLYTTQLTGKFMTYMMVALALDLMWGYTGLMNLGFAVFFGLGGYTIGISLASQNGIPAFMKSGGLETLPWFYAPLQNGVVAVALSILVPALVALFLGYFIFTSKIKGVFFNLITLAFAALFEVFIKTYQTYTGGSSGVNGIASGLNDVTFFGQKMGITSWYYVIFISLLGVYMLLVWLTEGRFGKVIKSVRDNEARLQFLGYNPAIFKLATFAISGGIAGFAGALYIPMTSFISIEKAGITFSTTILVYLAVGGRGNLVGAMFGALIVNILQSNLSSILGDTWTIVIGVILILIVMLLPQGIIGTIIDYRYNKNTTKKMELLKSSEAEVV
ncbi:MAG: urea ABC transporter permease subunit UrtC [Clostridia bacterium]